MQQREVVEPTPRLISVLPSTRRYRPPIAPGSLIGREQELIQAQTQLETQDVRLLTLVGPPGVGKTRLALALADTLQHRFQHGALFVDLSQIRHPKDVLKTIAQAFGLKQQGTRSATDQLAPYLQELELLLLLDNFEHLLDAATDLTTILAQAEHLRLMVTSRAALHVRWEHLFHVPPLDTTASIRLFAARAKACRPDFTVTPEIETLCKRLDGLPLAIELAASRSLIFTPRELLARLEARLNVLGDAPRDAADRHRTLREAIAWSYELLPEPEQWLFRQLATFDGGFTLDAAEVFRLRSVDTGTTFLDAGSSDVLGQLTNLVRHSLLRAEPTATEQPSSLPQRFQPSARFRYLETVREFAAEQLDTHSEASEANRHHAEYIGCLVDDGYDLVFLRDQGAWLTRLEQEHENLRRALRWTVTQQATEQALTTAGGLHWFWYARGYLGEGASWLAEVLALPDASQFPTAHAKALRAAGAMALNRGEFGPAREYLEHAVRINRSLGQEARSELAMSIGILGVTDLAQGRYEAAQTCIEQSLATYRELESAWGIATAQEVLGGIAALRGDHALASQLATPALAMHRQLGNRESIGRVLDVLGFAAIGCADLPTAEAHLTESLALRRALVNRPATAAALANLGLVRQLQGNFDGASTLYRESLALSQELGDRAGMVRVLGRIAALGLAAGLSPTTIARLGSAVTHHRDALALPLAPVERTAGERMTSTLRSRSTAVRLAAAWLVGRVMPLEDTVALGHSLLDEVLVRAAPLPSSPGATERLTRRELEVAALIAQGLTNRQIAEELVIAQRTAETHVERILSKLSFNTRAQVAVWAVEQGLLASRSS